MTARGALVQLILIAAALLWVSPAGAVFVKSQMDRIDHEPLFDAEYFLDVLGFSYPLAWDDAWRASTAPAYRVSGASLDCCDLLLSQELRLRHRLSENLALKFRLVQQDDKERQYLHHWLEFERRLGAGWSVSVFGEPTFRKEDSDIGLGVAYARGPASFSARRTFVDFDFNSRGSTTERYARLPASDEFAAEVRGAAGRFSAGLELDHPLSRQVPAEDRVFSYRRTTATVGWRRESPGWSPRGEYRHEFQRKGDLLEPDPAAASVSSLRSVHRVLAAAEGPLGGADRLEAGAAGLWRAARSDNAHASSAGVFYRRWELQPYARWRRAVRSYLVTELAAFLSFGEDRRRSASGAGASSSKTVAEAKLGAGLDFLSGPSGRLGLYGTFDLDSPAHPWDGGQMRAMVFF